jgi:ABC-type multidrug transport system fused ATPase/permease subunit
VNSPLQTLRRTLALIGTDRRWRWYLIAGFSLSLSAVELVGAGLIFLLVSLISSPEATVTLPLIGDLAGLFPGRSSRELRAGAAVFVAVFFIIRALYLLAMNYVQKRIIANAGAVLASDLLDGYLEQPYLFHTRRSSAELMRNTNKGVQELLGGLLLPSLDIVTKVLLSVTLIVTLILLSPAAMLTATAIMGGTVFVIQRIVRPRIIELARRSEVASKESIAAIQQSLGGIRDIKLLQKEAAFAGVHRQQRLLLARNGYLTSLLSAFSPLAIETALMLSIVTVFVLATVGTAGSQAALPVLAVFAYVGLRLQPVLQQIVSNLNSISASLPMLEILEADHRTIREWRAAVEREDRPTAGPEPAHERFQRISVESVCFAYDDDGPEVLSGVDLTIERGEFIGICGPTGGGKSTLVDLLIGLLQPTGGRIAIDGRTLGRRPLWWWDQIGVVSQSVFLTDDTLKNNIAFGGAGQEPVDEERLRRCVERAQLLPVIEQLPLGLETLVGERGIRLSGGQRQRVAIARALYREPEVLVLDEGTSALDGATERALVAAIDEATHERTLIAIAHRISTIRDADRILVVADGRIQDVGTHDELLARNALFQALA